VITIKQMLSERSRLQGVIDGARDAKEQIDLEVRTARTQMDLYNKLIAAAGGTEADDFDSEEYPCTVRGCMHEPFDTARGLATHKRRMHS
jgi:hypothetical protein